MFENMRGVPYFVKLRPGVNKFLTSAAEKFNIVLYTMGFKAYAKKVRELMDPTGHLIKAIISREDHNNRRGEDAKKVSIHALKIALSSGKGLIFI